MGCFAHCRKIYTDSEKALGKDADLSKSKVTEALSYLSSIYKLENKFKDLTDNEKYKSRLKSTKPILNKFYDWLLIEKERTLPKSLLSKAIKYSLNQWEELIKFLQDGRLSTDNNRAERFKKTFVLLRNSYLLNLQKEQQQMV